MKKSISAFLACAVMALSLAGCGEGGTPVPSSGNGPDGELPNTCGDGHVRHLVDGSIESFV